VCGPRSRSGDYPPHRLARSQPGGYPSRSHRGNFYRRTHARLGAPQAIAATAHKLARIVCHSIATGKPYDETVFLRKDHKQAQRHEKRLRNPAKTLGFQLVPIAA